MISQVYSTQHQQFYHLPMLPHQYLFCVHYRPEIKAGSLKKHVKPKSRIEDRRHLLKLQRYAKLKWLIISPSQEVQEVYCIFHAFVTLYFCQKQTRRTNIKKVMVIDKVF